MNFTLYIQDNTRINQDSSLPANLEFGDGIRGNLYIRFIELCYISVDVLRKLS